jgi:histone H3/H4
METTHMSENTGTNTPETEGGEVLVVASKIKNYIRAQSGMNTSAAVMDKLSSRIRELCDQAINSAKSEGRKTVMDRDFGL